MVNRLLILVAAAGSLLFVFHPASAVARNNTPSLGSPAEILAKHWSSGGPIFMPSISLGNFGVVDGHIFRGEQPGGKDYASLASIGVKTIIDLRADSKKTARRDAESAGFRYINIAIDGHGTPTDEQANEFLRTIDDPANGVVYVHCAGGRHRTGSMIAVYRMSRDGWTIDQAYDEMLAYDFYTSGGHEGFKRYVYDYARRMTVKLASATTSN